MKFSRRELLQTSAAVVASSGVLAAGCAQRAPVATENFDGLAKTLLDSAKDLMLRAYPETASSVGVDTGEYVALKSQLTDRSPAGQAAIANDVHTLLSALQKVDTDKLSADVALDMDVVTSVFERTAEGFNYPYGDVALLNYNWSYRNSPYAVAQNTGAFVEIPSFLDASHAVKTTDDADAYLTRMQAYAGQLDGETERVMADGARGVVLPNFLLEKTLAQLRDARDRSPAEWGIVQSIVTRAKDLGQYEDPAVSIAAQDIVPALTRQIEALEALAPKATSDAGVWAKPDGDAYYDWTLRSSTTTKMGADEVHQMGLDELADLHAQMEPILQSVGYTNGSVGARMSALGADKRYHFKPGDPGRAEIMSFIENTVTDIRSRMPEAFETLVPGFLEVVRISPDVEAGAPGAYGGAGSIDGTQPGHFWINLRSTDLHNKFNLADLTYHEAIPGHVWQGEYAFKQSLTRSLLAFNAYSEGWALYAQQIADELGVYDDFPVGRLGYLQSLAFRACRLVVDTGLHAKRWTREEANQWFVENNGSNPEEVRGEVDRYCAWPGQACGYKVGHSAINRLRDKAKSELGDQFDFRRFNDALVLGGNVPMTVLGRVIDAYIAREKQA
ncbi:hypothetical protein GCM10007853_03290 [Algimonas ampicilliniresistens]|uniref:DUF885 domain-containing protein n=1 Tax=Algimonas ampicilliniresistens TaxID=1298735 RepID=A0ABQ5V4Z7_9PROT|nr:DUF885 family protein [Algimonas ampicilliniresistens]GLQ22455.1 hypothetical protein GCM10007853_03290 [Algimonas ampicilliniresistens]